MKSFLNGLGGFSLLGAGLGLLAGSPGVVIVSTGVAIGSFAIASKIKTTYYRDINVGPRRKKEHF